MSWSSLNNFITLIPSVINIEKDKSFGYLRNFFEVKSLEILKVKVKEKDLINCEKVYHDMISNPSQHNVTRMKAWGEYINWIKKVFGSSDLRNFLVLENFTKMTINDKENYKDLDFCKYWSLYFEQCNDWQQVVKYMIRNKICTNMSFLYFAIAICFEKEHDFTNANLILLEGMDKKGNDLDFLQSEYKKFETRMEGRINREINTSLFSTEEIHKHIEKELSKKNADVFNENKKRLRNYTQEYMDNFPNRKIKVEKTTTSLINDESNIHLVQYGEIPVFIDENFRSNIITKGTKLVEKYNIMMKFFTENDPQIKIYVEQFNQTLAEEKRKKPVSWISGIRIVPNKFNEQIESVENKNTIKNNEEKIPIKYSNIESVDAIMEKMLKHINKKKEDNTNSNIINHTQENIPTTYENVKNVNNDEIIETHDGKKIRIIKVVTKNNKDVELFINPESRSIDIWERWEKLFYEKLENEKNKEKINKRKTIIYKLDSDGDVLMSSDEDEIILKENVPVKKDKKPQNNTNSTVNIDLNKNTCELKTNDETNVLKQGDVKLNLNLFSSSMTIDEIQEKIEQVTNLYEKGMIDLEQRNLLYNNFEEKINLLEKFENEKKIKDKAGTFYDKKTYLNISNNASKQPKNISNNASKQQINPFLIDRKKENPEIDTKHFDQTNVIIKNSIISKNLSNQIIKTSHPPLLEIPNNNITKKFEETPFSNVSRSLDFTNIKLVDESYEMEKNKKTNPSLASLFFDDKQTDQINKNNPFYKSSNNFSFSFESDNSHIFEQFDNIIQENEKLEKKTINRDTTHHITKKFNIKDTPELHKKKNNNNDPIDCNKKEINIDNINIYSTLINSSYRDYNDVKCYDNPSKEKLTKLFSDAFVNMNSKDEYRKDIHFALSDVTEKTLENTLLGSDSFFLKK